MKTKFLAKIGMAILTMTAIFSICQAVDAKEKPVIKNIIMYEGEYYCPPERYKEYYSKITSSSDAIKIDRVKKYQDKVYMIAKEPGKAKVVYTHNKKYYTDDVIYNVTVKKQKNLKVSLIEQHNGSIGIRIDNKGKDFFYEPVFKYTLVDKKGKKVLQNEFSLMQIIPNEKYVTGIYQCH